MKLRSTLIPTMGQAGMCLIWCRTESPILTNIINNMFALLRLYFEQEGCICLEQLVTLQLKAFFLGFYDYLYRNPEEKKAKLAVHESANSSTAS